MPCGCGGSSGGANGQDNTLSSTLDPRYGGASQTAEHLFFSQGFWVLALVVIGGAWAFSWIVGAPKESK